MEYGRRTDEDGRIISSCKKCRHLDSCVAANGEGKCNYEYGMSLHYVFHIGKHKGKTLSQVIEEDPDYLLWMTANVEWFEMSATSRTELLLANDRFLDAMYSAEVSRESKFISNNTKHNENDILQINDWGSCSDTDEESEMQD